MKRRREGGREREKWREGGRDGREVGEREGGWGRGKTRRFRADPSPPAVLLACLRDSPPATFDYLSNK